MTEPDEHALLAAARRGLSPTTVDQERVLRATAAALAGGAAGAAATTGSVTSRAWPWTARLAVVAVVAVGAVGLGYRAGFRAGRRDGAFAPLPTASSQSLAATSSATGNAQPSVSPLAPAPGIETLPTRPIPHRRAVADVAVAPPVPAVSLAEEVRALRAVERALRDGNPGFALALLRDLDRAVPNGQLVEERAATRIIARCTAGEVPMGVNLADDFASQYPDSVYGRRVADTCAATESDRSGDSTVRRPSHDKN